MKIENLKLYLVMAPPSNDGWFPSRKYIFVKIETDNGMHGWGEAFALNAQENSIAELIREMGQLLSDVNPLDIRKFIVDAHHTFAERRPNLTFYIALSALEMALWDISGKFYNCPVHRLLGGSLHNSIKLYVNFWSPIDHPEEHFIAKAIEYIEKGFSAVKIYPMRYSSIDRAESFVSGVRKAIGTETDLMIDMSGHPDAKQALQAAERFVKYNPRWIEEPVVHHDLDNLARINNKLAVNTVTGEKLAGLNMFRDVFLARAASIVNPDISTCGGIQTFLDIAAMANSFSMQVTPHNYGSMAVAQAAMLQVSALCGNCAIAEYFPYFQGFSDEISAEPLRIEKGHGILPANPGLGIDLDESVLSSYTI